MSWYDRFRRFLKPRPVATALASEVDATVSFVAVPLIPKAERGAILVVAHTPAIVESLKHSFHGLCQVFGATQVGEALRIVESEPIHVVLVDQQMPVMPGVEVLREVFRTKPEVIRLLFGGFADIRALTDALTNGVAYRYIMIPCDSEELKTIVFQAFDQYWRLRRSNFPLEICPNPALSGPVLSRPAGWQRWPDDSFPGQQRWLFPSPYGPSTYCRTSGNDRSTGRNGDEKAGRAPWITHRGHESGRPFSMST